MRHYESFQPAWVLLVSLGPIMALLVYLYLTQAGTNPMPFSMLIVMEALFIAVLLLFYGLTITVTDEQIQLKYGVGLIRKTIPLADIESVSLVRNKWYYGLGIRLIPNGMLYNVHGLDAVELKFWNKKRVVRIGSPDVRRLQREIEQRRPATV